MNTREWSAGKKWNPFNSDKLLAQVYRWRLIRRGGSIPQPALVTVDPINVCNLRCSYCNSARAREGNSQRLSRACLLSLADFLADWQGCPDWARGVEAVCIAGGGEPLLNEHVAEFIDRCLARGTEVGVVTNGTLIDRFLEPLSACTWVGVSVDAGCEETFRRLKDVDAFAGVIDNIRRLVAFSAQRQTRLSQKAQGYGVTYKFLLHPDNVYDVGQAIRKAKELGCRNFHLRPVGTPWNRLKEPGALGFSLEMLDSVAEQIDAARHLEDDDFGIFGITHKFGSRLDRQNCFTQCHAVFMSCVVGPSADGGDRFDLQLCCDRRGDPRLLLAGGLGRVERIAELWGGQRHWEIADAIRVADCPRCTYQPHNIIYEKVIQQDNMTYRFI